MGRFDALTQLDKKQPKPTPLSVPSKPLVQQQKPEENKETSFLVNKESVKQVSKETSKRVTYPKVTYQLNPLVTDMLEDTKRTLKRQYNIKVSLADIVEEAIKNVCQELQVNKETSFLVNKLSSNQENKDFIP